MFTKKEHNNCQKCNSELTALNDKIAYCKSCRVLFATQLLCKDEVLLLEARDKLLDLFNKK